MKQTVGILLSVVVLVFIFITGCQEQQEQQINVETPSEKQARLIAIENVQLKEQIRELNKRLASQRKRYEKNTQRLKASLKSAQNKIADLDSILHKEGRWDDLNEFISTVGSDLAAENKSLLKKNENLQSEVELLKIKIEELGGKVED
jgi:hypothetical protein